MTAVQEMNWDDLEEYISVLRELRRETQDEDDLKEIEEDLQGARAERMRRVNCATQGIAQ
jgi:hypothetical protein